MRRNTPINEASNGLDYRLRCLQLHPDYHSHLPLADFLHTGGFPPRFTVCADYVDCFPMLGVAQSDLVEVGSSPVA